VDNKALTVLLKKSSPLSHIYTRGTAVFRSPCATEWLNTLETFVFVN